MQLPFVATTAVPPNISFRQATMADGKQLHSVCYAGQSVARFGALFQQWQRWQANGRCVWLVAETAVGIVGNGQLLIYPHGAELANLFVIDTYRSRGIGTAMVGILTAVAQQRGLTNIEISVSQDNTRAFSLYQRLGFVAERRFTWQGAEAIVLRSP